MALEVLKKLDHMFGKIPPIVEDNIKVLFCEEDSLYCLPCDKHIRISEDKQLTKLRIEHHLKSDEHPLSYSYDEVKDALNVTFSGKIPQLISNNIHVLHLNEFNYVCAPCVKIIPESKDLVQLEKNFSYHLLSWGHLGFSENYKKTYSHLQQVVYGGINEVICCYAKYLTVTDEGFLCVLCNKELEVSPSPSDKKESEFKLTNHFLDSDHQRNVKQEKVFSLIPVLKQVYTVLPNHILRNIEYISFNGSSFFCSLCTKNIQFIQDDPYLTEQNLKLHNSSVTHEKLLLLRRDPDNSVYRKLHVLFEVFPQNISYNLKYLSTMDNLLICSVCDEMICGSKCDKKMIEEKIKIHFGSDWHKNNVELQLENFTKMKTELKEVFGAIPKSIYKNIDYLELHGGRFYCNLCKVGFDFAVMDPLQTIQKCSAEVLAEKANLLKTTFENHFQLRSHIKGLDNLKEVSQFLQEDVTSLFSHIPPFIRNSWNYIGCDEQGDFKCFLCSQAISVAHGPKIKEMTLQNFKVHLMSMHHLQQLKNKAKMDEETIGALEVIFGKVPNLILSSIEYLSKDGNRFCCSICKYHFTTGYNKTTIERYFNVHLKSENHKKAVRMTEKLKDEAFNVLDRKLELWRTPEFLLRNIDFMCCIGDDLHCSLCQEDLQVNPDKLLFSKYVFRMHFNSEKHQRNLQSLMK